MGSNAVRSMKSRGVRDVAPGKVILASNGTETSEDEVVALDAVFIFGGSGRRYHRNTGIEAQPASAFAYWRVTGIKGEK